MQTGVMMAAPGLESSVAAERLRRDGPNQLPAPQRRSWARKLAGQLFHFFAIMLWVAGVLAIVGDLVELGIAIFVVIVINALFAFVLEQRSDRAAERLRALLPQNVHVRRDGETVEIDATEVVLGDLLLLAQGDRIPADATVTIGRWLRVDTSLLTGESVPVSVEAGAKALAGTFVVDGDGEAEVTAVGSSTRLARIAELTTQTVKPETPLHIELRRVVRTIAAIAVSIGLLFLGLSALIGTSLSEAFIFAIGVTVALVPEGLLPTVTLSLAIGAQRMAERNALVRTLEAVETLGSTTFICTDKTGTLTLNEMTVLAAWTPGGSLSIEGGGYGPEAILQYGEGTDVDGVRTLALAGARCSTGRAVRSDGGWKAQGDPMEAALDAFARRVGVPIDEDRRLRIERDRFPFDAQRKRMSVLVGDEIIVKGAIDTVVPLCDSPPGADEAAAELTARGLRVLAVAGRNVAAADSDPANSGDRSARERNLELIGIVGLEDPPRPHAAGSIAACRRAGIKVAMITGDHPATALAIGREVGLVRDTPIVLRGDELPADDAQLGALVDRDGVIVSRVTPEDKLRIARALRARGHVLTMTGDGVNDAPALREADIGVAMGRSGTDVAREAADLVLLDDDFATIVAAVAQGRATFLNVRRFLTYHLTDNVAELTPFVLWALSGGRFPLALTVLQILALDIGTDTASASALGAEAPNAHVLDGPPVSGRLLNRHVALRAFGILGPTEALFEMLAFLVVFLASGWRPGSAFPEGSVLWAASGAAFLTVVIGQKANGFACRSATRPAWRLGWFTNRLLLATGVAELVFVFGCFVVVPAADALEQAFPPAIAWLVILASFPAVLGVDAWEKRHRSRRRHR